MPDFSQWSHGKDATIFFTGDRELDKAAAIAKWKKLNPGMDIPDGYVWHHDPHSLKQFAIPDGTIVVKGKMQLVPEALNSKISHVGGNGVAKAIRDAQGIGEKKYQQIAKAANDGAKVRPWRGSFGTAIAKTGKALKAAIPIVGGLMIVMNFKEEAEAHGVAGAIARATPMLGDVLTIYDLSGELANKIKTDALTEEANALLATNSAPSWASMQARVALGNALNHVLWKVSVPSPGVLDIEAIRSAFRAYFDTAQSAFLNYQNNVITSAQLQQSLQTAEDDLEDKLHAITGDNASEAGDPT